MSDDPNRIPDEEVDRLLSEQRRARIVRQRNIVLIAGSAVVVLLLIALVIWRLKRSATEGETEGTPTVSVKVVKAEKGNISEPISAVGTIWPREKADVAAKVSAQIKKMALLKNKVVHAGEVIAVLESRDLQAQRAQTNAVSLPAQSPRQTRKIRKHCSTREPKLTTHAPLTNGVAFCLRKAASQRKISNPHNSI